MQGCSKPFSACRKSGVFRDRKGPENAQLYLSGAMGKKPLIGVKPWDNVSNQIPMHII